MSVFKKTTERICPKKKQVRVIPPDISLQTYLRKYYKETLEAGDLGAPVDDSDPRRQVPVSIFARGAAGSSDHYAGIHDNQVHFSASLMKAAAMYAAFKLRTEARKLASEREFPNATAFFAALRQQFHSTDAVPEIITAGVGLEPRYADILTASDFGVIGEPSVDFVPGFFRAVAEDRALWDDFLTIRAAQHLGTDSDGTPRENAVSLAAFARISHMYRMIRPSNNVSAGECIRRLGYAYINVKMMEGHFYNPTHREGIWLAADFVGGRRVEIPSKNDDGSAQATTSRQMARLFSLIYWGDLGDSDNNEEMKGLLSDAQLGPDTAFLSRPSPLTARVDFEGVKVGFANLKPNTTPKGPNVFSEGLLLRWTGDHADLTTRHVTGEIAVCWQNVLAATNARLLAIRELVENTFSDFIKRAPLT
jgi:hypothetical protein